MKPYEDPNSEKYKNDPNRVFVGGAWRTLEAAQRYARHQAKWGDPDNEEFKNNPDYVFVGGWWRGIESAQRWIAKQPLYPRYDPESEKYKNNPDYYYSGGRWRRFTNKNKVRQEKVTMIISKLMKLAENSTYPNERESALAKASQLRRRLLDAGQ